jgi:hypothetical protein
MISRGNEMYMGRTLTIITLLLLLPGVVGMTDSGEEAETGSEETGKKERPFVIAPIVTSSPAFGSGGGLVALYFYRPSAKDEVSPPSTLTAFGAYSNTGSYITGLFNEMYLKEDRLRLTMGLAGGRLKNELEIPDLGTAEFSTNIGAAFARSEWRVGHDWFLGVQGGWGDVSYHEGNDISSE